MPHVGQPIFTPSGSDEELNTASESDSSPDIAHVGDVRSQELELPHQSGTVEAWDAYLAQKLMYLISYDAQRLMEALANRAGESVSLADLEQLLEFEQSSAEAQIDEVIGNIARNADWVGRNSPGALGLPFSVRPVGDELKFQMKRDIAMFVLETNWRRRPKPDR